MWESQETHVRQQPLWYDLSCSSGVKTRIQSIYWNVQQIGFKRFNFSSYHYVFPRFSCIEKNVTFPANRLTFFFGNSYKFVLGIYDVFTSLLYKISLTHYQMTNFRLFQTERVCRRQFQIWRKWQKVIQTGRNTVGKGEIARYEQFLLFPQCFQKACFPGASKGVIVWEWVKVFEFKKNLKTRI